MVPKDPDGNNYAFGVYQSAYNNLMHTMASGDLDGDGSDDIIFLIIMITSQKSILIYIEVSTVSKTTPKFSNTAVV